MPQVITGIQQVGIGVSDIDSSWKWYRNAFKTDVPVFDDVAEAALMTRYTGDSVQTRRAVLALNMNGGGGFEIWQFKSRTPEQCAFDYSLGDLGINAVKMKCHNVEETYHRLHDCGDITISEPESTPDGALSFFVTDHNGNLFHMVRGDSWFKERNGVDCGGVCGAIIGVSDIDTVLPLYREAFGFHQTVYDESGIFDDLQQKESYRRVLLQKPQKDEGAFSRLFGHIDIELIEALDREPKKIYKDRFWGDPGFIHICFDVNDMDTLQKRCKELGYSFTVDSASTFDMGEAAGRFSYIEDPDGTLIEFVQAHKLPVMKKFGWYINLKKRKHQKPLPDWILNCMSFSRVKD
jgi:catechol 2,3-dioxygenase-like lactoylglutathione lyase family enzyme